MPIYYSVVYLQKQLQRECICPRESTTRMPLLDMTSWSVQFLFGTRMADDSPERDGKLDNEDGGARRAIHLI